MTGAKEDMEIILKFARYFARRGLDNCKLLKINILG